MSMPLNAMFVCSVHIDAFRAQARLGLLNLCHQLLVCFGYIVEGKYAPAKLEEEVCAERDESPEW